MPPASLQRCSRSISLSSSNSGASRTNHKTWGPRCNRSGAAAVTAIARGIADWIRPRDARIAIRKNGEVIATNLSRDAARITKAITNRR